MKVKFMLIVDGLESDEERDVVTSAIQAVLHIDDRLFDDIPRIENSLPTAIRLGLRGSEEVPEEGSIYGVVYDRLSKGVHAAWDAVGRYLDVFVMLEEATGYSQPTTLYNESDYARYLKKRTLGKAVSSTAELREVRVDVAPVQGLKELQDIMDALARFRKGNLGIYLDTYENRTPGIAWFSGLCDNSLSPVSLSTSISEAISDALTHQVHMYFRIRNLAPEEWYKIKITRTKETKHE